MYLLIVLTRCCSSHLCFFTSVFICVSFYLSFICVSLHLCLSVFLYIFLLSVFLLICLTRCCSAHLWCHKASPHECWLVNKDARWSFSSSPPGKRGNDFKKGIFVKPVPATCSSPRSDLSVWGKFLRRWEPSLSRASCSPFVGPDCRFNQTLMEI